MDAQIPTNVPVPVRASATARHLYTRAVSLWQACMPKTAVLDVESARTAVQLAWLYELPRDIGLVEAVLNRMREGAEWPYELPLGNVYKTKTERRWWSTVQESPKVLELAYQDLQAWLTVPRVKYRRYEWLDVAPTSAVFRGEPILTHWQDVIANRIPQLLEALGLCEYVESTGVHEQRAARELAWRTSAHRWRLTYTTWWMHAARAKAAAYHAEAVRSRKRLGANDFIDQLRFGTFGEYRVAGSLGRTRRRRGNRNRPELSTALLAMRNTWRQGLDSHALRAHLRSTLVTDIFLPTRPLIYLYGAQVSFMSYVGQVSDLVRAPVLPSESVFLAAVRAMHTALDVYERTGKFARVPV